MTSMAHAQTAFDLTLDYIKARRAFGRPIGTFQNSRFVMAQLRAELHALQVFVDPYLQLHGGVGYMDEYRISRMYTDARVSRIFAGGNEIMKEIVGRGLGLDERAAGK